MKDGPGFYADDENDQLLVQFGGLSAKTKPVSVPIKGITCVAISADSKTLCVGSRSDWAVWTFPIERNGMLGKGRRHANLVLPRGVERLPVTALTTDTAGRVYAATREGIQVFDQEGRTVEVLSVPHKDEVIGFRWKGTNGNVLVAHMKKEFDLFTRRLNAKGTE